MLVSVPFPSPHLKGAGLGDSAPCTSTRSEYCARQHAAPAPRIILLNDYRLTSMHSAGRRLSLVLNEFGVVLIPQNEWVEPCDSRASVDGLVREMHNLV